MLFIKPLTKKSIKVVEFCTKINFNLEDEWSLEIWKENINNLKNGYYLKIYLNKELIILKLVDLSKTPMNIVHVKFNTFLSNCTKKFCLNFFDNKYKNSKTKIMLFFSNFILEREYVGISCSEVKEGFSFDMDLYPKIKYKYVENKIWWIRNYPKRFTLGLPKDNIFSYSSLFDFKEKMFNKYFNKKIF